MSDFTIPQLAEMLEQAKAKAMKSKRMCDLSMCPADLLDKVKEVYG